VEKNRKNNNGNAFGFEIVFYRTITLFLSTIAI